MTILREEIFVEKRRYRRVAYQEAIHYQFPERTKFGGCLSKDISIGGIQLNFNDFVPVNTDLTVSVKIKDIPKIIDVSGRVVWVKQVPYSDRYKLGLEFTNTKPFTVESIHSYVVSH